MSDLAKWISIVCGLPLLTFGKLRCSGELAFGILQGYPVQLELFLKLVDFRKTSRSRANSTCTSAGSNASLQPAFANLRDHRKRFYRRRARSQVEISSCSPTRRQRTSRTRCPSASPVHASGTTDKGHRALLLAEKEVEAESADGVMISPYRFPIITASPSKIIGAAECSGRRTPSRYG